ncbi:MAG TPA: MerR family transcriptional regulator [Chitinophagaceae bacterium]|nr:MerR family transcriptional regulator [Chitinophagaceae bacterium]
MNKFTIRDIENLCGIKAHTLRIWEQRYNLFTPKRKESQHRIYDCDDLKELLRISFLYHNGYKISKIAELTPEQVQEEIRRVLPQCCNYEIFVHQLIEASVQLDTENFERVVNGLVMRIGLEKSIIHIFFPFLQRIGLLWMTNHIIPAQEHFCSHIIRKKIICAIDGLDAVTDTTHNVVLFAPPGEEHEIPLLVINYFFRKNGIRTIYFGTNTSPETLQYYVQHHPVSHIYMHVITYLDSPDMQTFIESLCKTFPDKKIFVSGPACGCVEKERANLKYISSLEEMVALTEAVDSL